MTDEQRPSITPNTQEPVFRMVLPAKLTVQNRKTVSEAVDQAIKRGYRAMELDATETTFIDSSGLQVLAEAARAFAGVRGVLVMHGVNADIVTLFEFTKLDTIIFFRRAR